jgi:hypothetical protein
MWEANDTKDGGTWKSFSSLAVVLVYSPFKLAKLSSRGSRGKEARSILQTMSPEKFKNIEREG